MATGPTNAGALPVSQNQTVPESPTTHKVIFIDPFGVVNEQWVENGTNAIVPTPRVHEYLTFVEWNQSTENVTEDRVIGGTYNTSDGKTYVFVAVTAITGLTIYLNLYKNNSSTLTIDYGDGTISNLTNSGSFSTSGHTYATAGNYIIKMWISSGSGSYGFGNGNSYTPLIIGEPYTNKKYSLKKVYVGSNVILFRSYAFYSCYSFETITIPNNAIQIDNQTFNACNILNNIIFPKSILSLSNLVMQNCYSLSNFSYSNYITSFGAQALQGCITIKKIIILNSVTSIGANSFNGCSGVLIYLIFAVSPPSLADVSAFSGINPICKIYVPDASVNAYKTATNWVAYANYIYPLSQLN